MAREQQHITEAFAHWAKNATLEQLKEFAGEIQFDLYELEEDDYFGTEGLNKRLA